MATLKKETMDIGQSDRVRAWAQEALTAIESHPPASLVITLHQLRHSRDRSLARCFDKEYHFCQKFMRQHDMHEGLTSKINREQPPTWSPDNVFQLDPSRLLSYFHPPPPRTFLAPNSKDPMQHPFGHYRLPLEQEILKAADRFTVREDVVDHFQALQPQKVGVAEKVIDILSRNTRPSITKLE